MSKKKVKQGLSFVMSLLLCVTSANFSMLASAAEADAARIIGFNQLDESIASQNLPVGASIDDVIFPESIKATVETVEEVEVKKLIEKEKPDEAENEEVVSTDEDDTDVETEDKAAEPEEKAKEITADETIVEEEPTEPEAEQPEEIPAEETTESEPEATEDTEKEESVDSSFIDILFPAMIVHAAGQEEEPSLVSGAMAVSTEAEYETSVEKKVVHSEITISDVKWEIENGTKFDSSKETSFVFKPVFNTDYTINAETPTIKVNIVNTDSKSAFEKSQVVDGVRVNVKADAGVFPEEATLSVAKVSGQELQAVEEAVEEARADDKNKVESYTFDIKVLDKDGNEIEPDNSKGQVKVSFTLEEVADVNLDTDVYHVKGEVGDLSVDKLDAEEVAATTVEAVTDGFSFYTVEFTYNNLQYVMNGDTTVALSEILSAVGLEGEVSAATSDAPELFSVSKEDGVWYVTASQAFDTEQKLTVSIGGNDYVIVVTDASIVLNVIGQDILNAANYTINGTTGTAVYNPTDSILTLTDFSYVGASTYTHDDVNANVYTLIYYKGYEGAQDLTINLVGTNTLKDTSESLDRYHRGIDFAKGGIKFTGTGSLEVESGWTIYSTAKGENLTVEQATLKAVSDKPGCRGIYLYNGNLTVNSGTVEATANLNNDGVGIQADWGVITVNDGTLVAEGGYGISQMSGSMAVNGGTVAATGSTYGLQGNVLSILGGAVDFSGKTSGVNRCSSINMTGGILIAQSTSTSYSAKAISDVSSITIAEDLIKKAGYSADTATVVNSYNNQKYFKVSPLTHNFTYSASSDTLTAVCSDTDCPLTDKKVELKIKAPEKVEGTYDSSTMLEGLAAFKSATGLDSLTTDSIKYYQQDGTTEILTMPTENGRYVAKLTITINETPYTISVNYEIGEYDLWVGGTQVTSANKNNITGNSTQVPEAKYDSDTNTLYLTEFTASYDSPSWGGKNAIIYSDVDNLTINLSGVNTLSLSNANTYKCISAGLEKGFTIEGDGTLHMNGGYSGIYCSGQMVVKNVTITNENESYGLDLNYSGTSESNPAIRIEGANITLSGTYGALYTRGAIVVASGTVNLSKKAFDGNGGAVVALGNGIKAYSRTAETSNWAEVTKTKEKYELQDFNDASKDIRFGPKFEQVPLTQSEAFDAIGVDFENETVSPVIGYEVSSSNESYVPVTSLTELLDSDNPAIYVRKAETDTALASPWTEIRWPRPAAPSGIEGGAEEIIGTTTDMEYTKVGESTYTTASNTTTAVRAGEYLIRLKAGILNFASKPVKVVVYANEPVQETKDPQNPPTADQFTVTNAMPGKSDGAISGVTKAMEYSADNGVTWTLIKANPLTGLAAGTYLIRYAETAEKEASDSIAIKVDEKETGSISILVKPENSEEQRSFEIRVEKGNSIVATRYFGKISEAGSTVTFEDLEVGIYNIICLSTNEEFAETKLLTVEKGKVTDIAFTVLPGEIKTLVTVGEDAPAVAVDGLSSLLTPEEKEAAANGDKAITVELTAEKAPETATGVEDIKNIMTPGQTIDTVLDLSLIKITKDLNTNEETKNDIGKDNDKVLEIAIPYDVADGKEISIFRYHEDANGGKTTKQFSSLSGRLLAGLYEDAKFFFDRIKKYIYLYASDFSTYAIAISDSSETASASTSSESGSNSPSGIKTVPVYRLFNPIKGYHFYTADAAERDALVAAGWSDEGIAWQAGDKNGKAVYRLFDVNGTGGHIFTTSEEEKAAYIAKGYRDEGIGWYAPSYAGRKVYKITNKTNGQVLYTISMDEKNALEAAGFVCEEAGFVVY